MFVHIDVGTSQQSVLFNDIFVVVVAGQRFLCLHNAT